MELVAALAIIALFLIIFAVSAVKVVQPYQRGVKERLGKYRETLDPGSVEGLGGLAHLGRRALPGPDLGERRQVGALGRGVLEQPERLFLVGHDVLAAVGLAQGDPHVRRCYRGGGIVRVLVPAPLMRGSRGPTLEA